jgi:hypothetical protein
MNDTSLLKAGILTFILVAVSVISWELYVRHKGFDASYDDGGALWSDKRKMVYEPSDATTVFVGSSRIKFDLDIDYWENVTGSHAVQLACVGSTPMPILLDLAADEKFKGKIVLDVTEILFFSDAPPNRQRPDENLKYYKQETPAQKAGFYIDHFLESNFVFLDKDRLSLNAKLAKLQVPNRPGVFEFPLFPDGFGRSEFNRQEYMTDEFLKDSNQQNQVKGVWSFLAKQGKDQPPLSGALLDSMFARVKTAVDKIKARGGDVIFVRTPSTGRYFMGENMGYPRQKYFDKLLEVTNCKGIHFLDYPAISHLQCPEFSHLSRADATVFTKELVRVLHDEKGWLFPKLNGTVK